MDQEKGLQTIRKDAHVVRINEFSSRVRDAFGVFGIALEVVEVKLFPDGLSVLLRPLEPVRMHVLRSFEDDLRFALGMNRVEIIAPIPNRQLVGVTLFMDVDKEIYGIDMPKGVLSPWALELQEEALYEEAKSLIQETGNATISFLQTRFDIGYSRAEFLITLLEERGVIGPDDGTGKREIYPDR